jgi:hypothetical protein
VSTQRVLFPFEGSEEEKLTKSREVRDLIEKRIKDWVAEQNLAVP